jgi:hypothetical protein
MAWSIVRGQTGSPDRPFSDHFRTGLSTIKSANQFIPGGSARRMLSVACNVTEYVRRCVIDTSVRLCIRLPTPSTANRPRVNAVEPLLLGLMSLLLVLHDRPLINGLSVPAVGQGLHTRVWVSLEVHDVTVTWGYKSMYT